MNEWLNETRLNEAEKVVLKDEKSENSAFISMGPKLRKTINISESLRETDLKSHSSVVLNEKHVLKF